MSAVKDHHWRFRPYELDDLCQRHGLNFTDVGVFRRLLERVEWRPQNRGFLTTTYTELADPCGDREAMSRSIARLAKTPLLEIHVPFGPRAKGTLRVPVAIYQKVVKVSTTVDPADDADLQDDGESDEAVAVAVVANAAVSVVADPGLRGIFAAPSRHNRRDCRGEPAPVTASGPRVENRDAEKEKEPPTRVKWLTAGHLPTCPTCGKRTYDPDRDRCGWPGCASRRESAAVA